MADLTPRQYRQLRDMADGHLNLYATVRNFDPTTGNQVDPPELLHVGHDRPDIADPDWWRPLLAAGLIALPVDGSARCAVTLDGHKAVAAHRTKESGHG
ncbi:hypothetical protein AB0L22_09205 [Micromonospora haikouensis]|uniref:hypothetical protein n=1 Tax=Micromonospora haikouensis TaxID=686309 RepID=UPI00344712BD